MKVDGGTVRFLGVDETERQLLFCWSYGAVRQSIIFYEHIVSYADREESRIYNLYK